MPTYEYACPKCGHTFELFQQMSDKPLTKCPNCKKAGVKRLVGSGAGLIFKGSGFYITDYKNKDSARKEKEAGGGETKPSESKPTESKPAESKPTESKASESKPAESKSRDSKPAESKPAVESKPASPKPAASPPEKKSSSARK